MKDYEMVVGLEVHAELNTKSKFTVTAAMRSVWKSTARSARSAWVCREHFRP